MTSVPVTVSAEFRALWRQRARWAPQHATESAEFRLQVPAEPVHAAFGARAELLPLVDRAGLPPGPRQSAGVAGHGLVMPSRGRTRVPSRALRRSAAAMLCRRWRRRMPMARGCAGWPWPWVCCQCGPGRRPRRRWCRGGGAAPRCPSGRAGSSRGGGVGLGGGEVGDRGHRHGPPSLAGKRPDPAGDADRLGGVREARPATMVTGGGGARSGRGRGRGCGRRSGWRAGGRVASWWWRLRWLAFTISR